VSDWDLVRQALTDAGLPSEDFGRFTSGDHSDLIRPEDFDYQNSVPVLLRCLPLVEDPAVKEAIVRSLSTSAARPAAADLLIAEFIATSDADQPGLKWAIGNALNTVADKGHAEPLRELALDRRNGRGRQMIVSRLGNFKANEAVTSALITLLDDENVALHAMSALRQQVGPKDAGPYIEAQTNACSEAIRRTAAKQLKSIDRKLAATAE
jgi:hypothetical protein